MYIRTQEEALSAVAEILDLPQRRDQIVQSTVKIMLCLESEPRGFLVDCQALLVEGGLEALQRKRRDFLASFENVPLVVLDPEDDRLFEATARALDALRFAGVFFQVFPEFARVYDRWWVARAILAREEPLRNALTAAIRARRYVEEFDPVRLEIQSMIIAERPEWIHRLGDLRSACRDALRRAGDVPADRQEQEAEAVFQVLAVSDERVRETLAAWEDDPVTAGERIRQAYGLVVAVRSMLPAPAGTAEKPGVTRVA